MKTPSPLRRLKIRRNTVTLALALSLTVMCILLLTIGVVFLLVFILDKAGVLYAWESAAMTRPLPFLLIVQGISLILGILFTFFLGRIPLHPIVKIIEAMNSLAEGDFSKRLHLKKPFSKISALADFTESFNTMAAELEHTEILRKDFINNFSHEFKTPIVSIAGFAKLLRRGSLSREEQAEYLEIIEKESLRLSTLAANTLTVSKLENQNTLGDVSTFNLSEQIRSCILLLENKWTVKNLDMDPDFDEFYFSGDEEMMSQVWLNLLDNAVKFSPECGRVHIFISRLEGFLSVSVSNAGEIPADKLPYIFQKFYQADESHSVQGNGIGLAIVERIVHLHGGSVSVSSSDGETAFTVMLPA